MASRSLGFPIYKVRLERALSAGEGSPPRGRAPAAHGENPRQPGFRIRTRHPSQPRPVRRARQREHPAGFDRQVFSREVLDVFGACARSPTPCLGGRLSARGSVDRGGLNAVFSFPWGARPRRCCPWTSESRSETEEHSPGHRDAPPSVARTSRYSGTPIRCVWGDPTFTLRVHPVGSPSGGALLARAPSTPRLEHLPTPRSRP